jgi:hypothetical protein
MGRACGPFRGRPAGAVVMSSRKIKNQRNAMILLFMKDNPGWSYQLIADKFDVSRCAVAGIVFRSRHPANVRVGYRRSKIGTGWREPSYYPAFTAATHQVKS